MCRVCGLVGLHAGLSLTGHRGKVIRAGRAAVVEDTELFRIPESEDEHGGLMQSRQSGRLRAG